MTPHTDGDLLKLAFGDAVENIAASDCNPLKRGIFIRKTSAKMAEYATKEGVHSTPLDNLRALAYPAPRSEVRTTAIAWHACDDRYPYIRGIVTTQQETVDAWREAGIKFEALAPVCVAQAVPDPEASIPTYGNIPWDQLGRDVMEAVIGARRDYEFDPKFYPGHQTAHINFNSLARIVDKYRVASTVPSAHRVCAKCGCETKSEEALVTGEIWCHPCADLVAPTSADREVGK